MKCQGNQANRASITPAGITPNEQTVKTIVSGHGLMWIKPLLSALT
jgi:hypothetical protein